MEELDRCIANLKIALALGPDGIPLSFIKNFWPIIKHPIKETFNHHLRNKTLPEKYRSAHLKLIPKPGDTKLIKNWQPITVLNAKYKLLSAVYMDRLKKVIAQIVGREQKGFSCERRAHEAILNMTKLLTNMQQWEVPCVQFCLILLQLLIP